ncbi:MAG: ADP-ribosylation factor-like protein [Candidatus Helarchaeota archaeon]
MLREIHILRGTDLIYWRQFGDAVPWENLSPILFSFANSLSSSQKILEGILPDLMGFKISYTSTKEMNLLFVFVSDVSDSDKLIKKQLKRLKDEFQDLFSKKVVETASDPAVFESLNPIADLIHKDLRPKIALVGFSGVGKTTITRLIRADKIPKVHNPTMTGDIHTVKIGKLHFNLWDFAGQEQFSFLWPKFVKDSDAVLIITDSTLKNIEKSKFFIKLTKEKVPTARLSVVANKQDLPDALTAEEIEKLLKIKTYGMIAVDPNNRAKMIELVAQTLGITSQVSPLIKPLLDRDKLVEEAEQALMNGEFQKSIDIFENIAKYCLELGDSKIANEFIERAKFIKSKISGFDDFVQPEKVKEAEKVEIKGSDINKPTKQMESSEMEEDKAIPEKTLAINSGQTKPEVPKAVQFKTPPKIPTPIKLQTPSKPPNLIMIRSPSEISEPVEPKKSIINSNSIEKKPPIEVTTKINSNNLGKILNKLDNTSKKDNIQDDIKKLQAEIKKINREMADLESKFQQKSISKSDYQSDIESLRNKRKDLLYKITQIKIGLIK